MFFKNLFHMKNPVLNKKTRTSFFFTVLNQVAPLLLFFLVFQIPLISYGQSETVLVTENQNNVLIQEVRYSIDGQELIQNAPEGNENPLPADVPAVISSILIEGDRTIFATTRSPIVQNPNPVIGGNEISSFAVQIVRSDNTIISHRDPAFFNNLETIVSTPDIRSYWDINSQPSIPRGDQFVDLIYTDQVITSGYLMYTERGGNSATDFIALDRNGNPIENAKVIEVRGWQWDSGINHVSNVPDQTQHLILFSPMIFESTEPIYGIRIIAGDEPDGKMVFFVNALSATPDLAERVNSEQGAVAVLNIFDNDELNGFPLNPIDVQMELVEPFPNNTIVLNSDGTVDVPPNTAPGVYTAIYEITTAGGEFDRAEIRIEVILYIPEAFDDIAQLGDSFGQDSVINVLGNDMLNGLPALIENVNLTELINTSGGALVLNEDGSVDVAIGTPEGTYQLTYQICDKEDPSKCDQGVVTISVAATELVAVNDDFGNLNLNRGGAVGNVISNDLLNGEPIEEGRTFVELVDDGGLSGITLSEEGELTLPTGLPDGDYTLTYDLKETINPNNSDRGEIRFSLLDIQLEANNDQAVTNQNDAVIIEILENDFINTGELLVETLLILEGPQNGALGINNDGSVTYTPATNFSGQDQFSYELCENTDRQFCDQAIVTVQVRPILLDLSKTSSSAELSVGEMVTYTIQLTNNSEFELSDILIEDVLPNGLEFLSAIPTPEESGNWIIESIPQGGSRSITIEAMATDLGQVVNIATVTIGDYTDQVQSLPVTVQARPVEISISKTSFGIEIYEGNEFEYEIRLVNTGSNIAENITIQDELPNGLVFLDFSSEGFEGSPNVSGNTLTWVVPSIGAGQEIVFLIRVQANQVGMVSNTATLTLPEDQENLSPDGEATDTNQVRSFFIPNVITPGKLDGKNDTFEIRGLQRFASSSLTILNRNGDHVYESDEYQNDWAANGLNAGSFYYVLVITDSQGVEQVYKGWVQVIK